MWVLCSGGMGIVGEQDGCSRLPIFSQLWDQRLVLGTRALQQREGQEASAICACLGLPSWVMTQCCWGRRWGQGPCY